MAARSRYLCLDPSAPEAAGRCDRGGEVVPLSELAPQMRWAGDRLVATGWLVCPRHMDTPNAQDRPPPVSRDPDPVSDPRPLFDGPLAVADGALLGVDFVLGLSPLSAEEFDLLDVSFDLDRSSLAP